MAEFLADLGMRFPRETSKKKKRFALYKCECGREFEAIVNNVSRGRQSMCSHSCGLYDVSKYEITKELLHTLFNYDKETGIFTRKARTARRQAIGEVVGVSTKKGYLKAGIGNKEYMLHRLAWVYVYGYMPLYIDHINHITNDNRISNLREVTAAENQQNKGLHKNSSTGHTGVQYLKKENKFKVSIMKDGKQYEFGKFDKLEDAVQAKNKAYKELGFHYNHGISK